MSGSRTTRTLAAIVAALIALATRADAQEKARTTSDSARIIVVLAQLDSAWHAGDASAWVSHYAPDASFINITGMRMSDTITLRARLAAIFGGVFKGSRHVGTLHRMRFLAPNVAVVDEDIEITGFNGLPAGISPTEPGVLRTRMRHVMERRGQRWIIVTSQNTAVVK